jgi:hypothetical protein
LAKLSHAEPSSDDAPTDNEDGTSAHNSLVLPATIPFGFQQLRLLLHNKPSVRSALYMSSGRYSDGFVSIDANHVHIWRGTNRIKKRTLGNSVDLGQDAIIPLFQGGGGLGGLSDPYSQWVYVRRWSIFVFATEHLQLKVLDQNLMELSRTSSSKPVLCLESCDDRDEIVVGCVAGVKVCYLQFGIS